jgi:hypothetical protein
MNTAEEEPIMSGASSGSGTRFRYDEDVSEIEVPCDEWSEWDSAEGRMVELGLS